MPRKPSILPFRFFIGVIVKIIVRVSPSFRITCHSPSSTPYFMICTAICANDRLDVPRKKRSGVSLFSTSSASYPIRRSAPLLNSVILPSLPVVMIEYSVELSKMLLRKSVISCSFTVSSSNFLVYSLSSCVKLSSTMRCVLWTRCCKYCRIERMTKMFTAPSSRTPDTSPSICICVCRANMAVRRITIIPVPNKMIKCFRIKSLFSSIARRLAAPLVQQMFIMCRWMPLYY